MTNFVVVSRHITLITGFQSGVANDVGVHWSTVIKTVHIMDQIINKSNKWIKFLSNLLEINKANLLWQI